MSTALTKQSTGAVSKMPRSNGAAVKAAISTPYVDEQLSNLLKERKAQFCSSMVSQANQLPKGTDPKSIIAACVVAATLDLPINKDLGHAHIVPYKGKAQFQLGYKGLVQLAQRSGQYQRINAVVVREGALIKYDPVTEEIEYDPEKMMDETKPVIGYLAYFRLNNGFEKRVYWTRKQTLAHARQYSQAYRAKKKDSPWFTAEDAMCLKTVLKITLSKWGPLSVEMQRAVLADQGVFNEIGGDPEYIENPTAGLEIRPPKLFAAGDKPQAQAEVESVPVSRKLSELMQRDKISEGDVLSAAIEMGLAKEGDELPALPDEKLAALVAGWDTLSSAIQSKESNQDDA